MTIFLSILFGFAFVAVIGGAFWIVIVRGGRQVEDAAAAAREARRRDASIMRDIEDWRAGK